MKQKQQLTQQIIVTEKDKNYPLLDKLCFLSKNLYNAANYLIRQQYITDKKHLNYYDVNKVLHDRKDTDYNALPYTQMSQQVLRQVDSNYKAFFKSLKSDKMKGKHVRIPSYKDKENGRNIAVYTNQIIKVTDGMIRLKVDKEHYVYIQSNKSNIQQVRVVPKGNHIVIEVIYNVFVDLKPDNKRYSSIDLGINNICTLTSNVGQATIFNGRKIKSVNAYYNKRKAELQSYVKKGTSKRIKRLNYKRNMKMKDMMHKLSHQIVQYINLNSINTLIIGKNRGWKDGISLSKVTNQNFVSIPYNMLVQMLKYKCLLAGITVIEVNEAYTSKCSFFDDEKICKHDTYKGRRVKRGLFITESGLKVNADVNGSLNIMKVGLKSIKVKLDVLEEILRPENRRFVLNPVVMQLAA